MNETEVEQIIQEKNLNAPRITPQRIEDSIIRVDYWQPHNTTLTVCMLQLKNGTCVVGESACVSMENFDYELGQSIAYGNARDKIWALEGYLLKQQMYESTLSAMPIA